MKLHKIINAIEILVLGLIVLGVFTFARVCGSMETMEAPCHKTRFIAVIVAVVLAVLTLIQLISSEKSGLFNVKNGLIGRIIALLQLIGGVVIALIPLVFAPVCSMKVMHCYVYTRPLLIISGIVITGITIIDFLILLKIQR